MEIRPFTFYLFMKIYKSNKKNHSSVPPFINDDSKILILGSLPSVKSSEVGFYYAHPTNRFFKTLANVFNEGEPKTVEERKMFLRKHKIALYDVIEECSIHASDDNSIKDVKPADIKGLIRGHDIVQIFTTGSTSYKYYNLYIKDTLGMEAIMLPSTSAANGRIKQEALNEKYSIIKDYLNIK